MGFYKRKKLIERLVMIGEIKEQKKCISWCYNNGYAVMRSGPKPISRTKFDSTKFKIIAEKEV